MGLSLSDLLNEISKVIEIEKKLFLGLVAANPPFHSLNLHSIFVQHSHLSSYLYYAFKLRYREGYGFMTKTPSQHCAISAAYLFEKSGLNLLRLFVETAE